MEKHKQKDVYIHYSKLNFYFNYFLQKLIFLPFNVKKPRYKFYFYELIYSFMKFIDRRKMFPYPFNEDIIVTNFGSFYIRSKTTDAVVVSPAYEYLDRKHLLKIIKEKMMLNRKIIFIDIGSNIGTYPIIVENLAKNTNYKSISIFAFEPDKFNYEILKKNLAINDSKFTKAINLAISNSDNTEIRIIHNKTIPGASKIDKIKSSEFGNLVSKTKKFDTFIKSIIKDAGYKEDITLIIKIDTEGEELNIIDGMIQTIKEFPEIYLCIEGFYGEDFTLEIIKKLKSICENLEYSRFTPYNFWVKKLSEKNINE